MDLGYTHASTVKSEELKLWSEWLFTSKKSPLPSKYKLPVPYFKNASLYCNPAPPPAVTVWSLGLLSCKLWFSPFTKSVVLYQ